jgi:predicted nuclease with TOPRIM domain
VLSIRLIHHPWLRHFSPIREDCLERIKHLQMEVDADLKQMEQGKTELLAIEERLKRMKKERGLDD